MKTTLDLADLGENIEAEVIYDYTPSTPDVYYMPNGDPGYPGDPEEIDITELWGYLGRHKVQIPLQCLTESAYERICDEISEYERKQR
jgi:hypothetical protein